jgi:hypothetical protein
MQMCFYQVYVIFNSQTIIFTHKFIIFFSDSIIMTHNKDVLTSGIYIQNAEFMVDF